MIEPSWTGRRVSVRRVVERAEDGRLLYGDVVGDLVGLDAQTAVIDTRSGPVEVPLVLVALARLVPASTAQELALEAVAARGMRAVDSAELGGWLMRADHGFLRRANAVLPLRQLGLPMDDALARARAWYAERGLPLRIATPVEGRRLLDAELGDRGWSIDVEAHVLAARLDHLDAGGSDPSGLRVMTAGEPDDAWLALYRGGEATSPTARALLARHDRVTFVSLVRDGELLAIGRGVVDDDWLGVSAVEVVPDARRQGLATAVMRTLWAWGVAQGARRSYLQVEVDNAAAVALYRRLGYWVHHDYRYWLEPPTRPL